MQFLKIVTLLIHLACMPATDDSLYNISFTTIDGSTKNMSDYAGKKVMVVVLSTTDGMPDISLMNQLDSISRQYTTINVIAIPSFEEGFDSTRTADLLSLYNSLSDSALVLSSGMYTHKTSDQQNSLFYWLTHQESNVHFDADVSGPLQTFFINEQGELYGEFSAGTPLTQSLVERMIE